MRRTLLKSCGIYKSGEIRGIVFLDASFPIFDPKYLIESSKEYPISINGRMRTTINIILDASAEEVEKIVLENEVVKNGWMTSLQKADLCKK